MKNIKDTVINAEQKIENRILGDTNSPYRKRSRTKSEQMKRKRSRTLPETEPKKKIRSMKELGNIKRNSMT